MPNFILLPRAAEELKIPFVASGGMADGRSLVAALAMGADGMNMGTRFIATKEAPVHENVKQALVAASELDTRLVMRPLRNTERVLKNAAVERLLEKEKALGAEHQVRGHLRRGRRRLSEDHEGRRDGRRRLVVRHGRRPHPRHPDREGADRPHHERGGGASSASGSAASCATDLDDDLAFRTTCFDVGQSLLGRFEWKDPIDDRAYGSGIDEGRDLAQLSRRSPS